jgi:DNA gyrase subunit B
MKGNPRIVRYKGLGEMNPDTLWETTLDPAQRTLLRVGVDDEKSVAEALKALMGSDPATRYQLIVDNADALELDV